jgi:sugar phosphate isomerase/epimerase
MADELNKYGERTKGAGLQLGYHNHEIEFVKTPQGDVPWDLLVQATDPALVRFLLDVGNCAFGGGDPYAYLDKYKPRYYGVHVKDFVKGKAAVPVGSGSLDWKRIFTLVKAANITNIVAEVGAYGASTLDGQPLAPPEYSVLELYKRSAEFLKAFKEV